MILSGDTYIHSGANREISLTVETPSATSVILNKEYECVVTYSGKEIMSETRTLSSSDDTVQITCAETEYSYSSAVQLINASLRIRLKGSDAYLDGRINVILYKCEVDRPDCSRCLPNITTPPVFNCGWCSSQSTCTVSENCGETIQQQCTDPPTITSSLPYHLTKFHLTSLITTRYVEATVEAIYENRGDIIQEIPFAFKLSPQAYVSSFLIDVDGVPYQAEVVEKGIAQKTFNDSSKRKQSAGYARQSGSPLRFQVDLDVNPGSNVTFRLSYEDLLKSDNHEYTHRVNIAPGQVVKDFKVETFIMETQGLKSLNSFWIPRNSDLETSIEKTFQEGMTKASVRFTPSPEQQGHINPQQGLSGTFVLKYDLVHRPVEGRIEINDGHFAHFISPENLPPAPKKVVFVMDLSGSMYGQKLQQTKISLRAIIGQLREDDLFNIVVFSSMVDTWRPRPVQATAEAITEAQLFVDTLYASGGTNINDALLEAATEFSSETSTFHAIIFMTDGIPSAGETDSEIILTSVTKAIYGNAALFCIGFGSDVDEFFLQRLAASNRGVYRRVVNDETAAAHMEGFFQEVASPLLFNVRVVYDEFAVPTETLTKNDFASIFNGKEVIIAGMIKDEFNGVALSGQMTANSAGGDLDIPVLQDISEMPPMPNMVGEYTEKIWAYLRIKQLLQQEQLATSTAVKEYVRDEALRLSLKYHLVTPLTALLFYTPPDPDPRFPHALAARLPEPEELFTGLYRTAYSRVFGDPHFVIDIPNSNLTVCFDVHGEKGTIVNLLTDKKLDILVNARMWPFIMKNGTRNSLFNRIGVKLEHHTVLIAGFQVLVDSEMSFSWKKRINITLGRYKVAIQEKGLVTISHGDDIVMKFQRHIWKDHPRHFDFFLVKADGLSNQVHGIVGQFQRRQMAIVDEVRLPETGIVRAVMSFSEKEAHVYQRAKFSNRGYKCWWAKSDVYLDGRTEQYIVPRMFDHMEVAF